MYMCMYMYMCIYIYIYIYIRVHVLFLRKRATYECAPLRAFLCGSPEVALELNLGQPTV